MSLPNSEPNSEPGTDKAPDYAAIVGAFATSGMTVRGGCRWETQFVVLLGNVGGSLWPAFATGRRDEPDPLDAWSKRIVIPIASALGVAAVFPSDRPYQPFQTWALAAEPLHASPLGLLIHPDYGLWHAYRAALIFDHPIAGIPDRDERPSPCDSCLAKPCLSACPVEAFSRNGYAVGACATHLAGGSDPDCRRIGCRARDACPIGRCWRYSEAQIAFHMNAFAAARLGRGRAKADDGEVRAEQEVRES